jgi:hypothetical protein
VRLGDIAHVDVARVVGRDAVLEENVIDEQVCRDGAEIGRREGEVWGEGAVEEGWVD